MPLLKKQPFERVKPPDNLKPDDLVFYSEATKEIFTDYEDFFQRTIMCNSLVWSCNITGKSNLTYEEALESERKAKKRLGNIPKPLKKSLLWLASHTKKGRLFEVCDDVYLYANSRFFKDEIVEAIIKDQWCDAKIVKVIPPTEEEIAEAVKEAESEEQSEGSPKKDKEKKKFFPHDNLFKYEVEEADPEDEDMVQVYLIEAEDVRREKGILSKEKLNLFMKNVLQLPPGGTNFMVKPPVMRKYGIGAIKFEDFFAGPEPEFQESLRKTAKKGTLDGWVKTGASGKENGIPNKATHPPKQIQAKPPKPEKPVVKKQTPEEIEAEMKKMREQQAKFKEEMRQRAEMAKKKRIEEKAREKERKKEEQRLIKELMNDWTKKRDDLECEDLKELPKPTPVHCKIPNQMFGDFVMLLEFLHSFYDILEVKDSYPGGVSFKELEQVLTETDTPGGALYEILNFMLVTLFDLQLEEEEEAKADTDRSKLDENDRNVLGKDEEWANAIKTATEAATYTKRNLGIALREVHIDEMSVTEVLRLHLESSGAYRGNNLQNWRYQQRGGYRLNDDPGLQFRMDEPQILAALESGTVYDLNMQDKMKVLNCLMNQMMTYAGVRDEIDTRYDDMYEAKTELREITFQENRRIRQEEEEEKRVKKEKRMKEVEERLKRQEEIKKELEEKIKAQEQNKENKDVTAVTEEKKEEKKEAKKEVEVAPLLLTTRQSEAAQAQKEKDEKEKLRLEEVKKSEWYEKERKVQEAIADFQNKVSLQCLGRDRAYRRFWSFESVPGVFVEHDDDFVGECQSEVTPFDPKAGPISEEEATKKARDIMQAKESPKKEKDEKSSSDKENDDCKIVGVVLSPTKTYSKVTPVLGQTTNNEAVKPDGEAVVDAKDAAATVVDKEVKAEEMETDVEMEESAVAAPWGGCVADKDNCVVHSAILPKTHWSFYSTEEDLDTLISSLNERGFRESELKENLIFEREKLEKRLKKCPKQLINKSEEQIKTEEESAKEEIMNTRVDNGKAGEDAPPIGTPIYSLVEFTLRDQLLELEEKIFFGSLGSLKVKERLKWQEALQSRGYTMCCDGLTWGGSEEKINPLDSIAESAENSRPSTPEGGKKRDSTGSNKSDVDSDKRSITVKQLACAILQVGQMVDKKYFKEPLGEDEKNKAKRLKEEEKRKKDAEANGEDEDEIEEVHIEYNNYLKWERSLMSCTNLGQLFMHLTTLDSSIVWSKSIMNTKCRICRRKTDPDSMLLCDGCDRGHHLYCLKPKLKNVPKGDWFCPECKPKERIRSPKKKMRRVFSSTETDEETENDEEEEEEEESQEEDGSDYEEEELPPPPKKKKGGNAKKKLALGVGPKGSGNKKKGLASLLSSSRPKRGAAEKEDKDEETGSRGKRRRDVDDDIEMQFNVVALEDLVKSLMDHKDGWPFDRPITKKEAPDYHLCVRYPMDLGTIRSKMNNIQYTCNQEVLDDIKLCFKNCFSYNEDDTDEYKCGVRLEKYFDKEVRKMGLAEDSPPSKKSNKKGRF